MYSSNYGHDEFKRPLEIWRFLNCCQILFLFLNLRLFTLSAKEAAFLFYKRPLWNLWQWEVFMPFCVLHQLLQHPFSRRPSLFLCQHLWNQLGWWKLTKVAWIIPLWIGSLAKGHRMNEDFTSSLSVIGLFLHLSALIRLNCVSVSAYFGTRKQTLRCNVWIIFP